MILLQEIQGRANSAEEIASKLRMHCLSFTQSKTAILSHKRITKVAEGSHFGIAKIGRLYYCVIHLSDTPYTPFEVSGIPYPEDCGFHSRDPKILVRRSLEMRGRELIELIDALTSLPSSAKVIAGGDFNEPSHLDWTPEAARRGEVPVAIKFPCSRLMEVLNFVDTYREINDDLGYTWPDREIDYEYRSDRIDFIFAKNLDITSSEIIKTGLSDHAMVVSEVLA